ncbi:MAG: MATE family efflux transporter [Herbinix sp.]|nr:MATE family efflux transporter [Herbinix sp.]
MLLRRYIGNKSFYTQSAKIMIPLAIQSILSSSSAIIDTMMVSWTGKVTAVGTATQLDALMQATAFGIAVGINIFLVQYFGSKDYKNMRKTFGLSLISMFVNALVWFVISSFLAEQLLYFFINDSLVIIDALEYLKYAMWSFFPTCLLLSFTFAYHSIQKTYIPLYIGIITTIIHIGLNYMLIFGYFGFPELGIYGAGLSVFLSQMISLLIHIFYAYFSKQVFLGNIREMFTFSRGFILTVYGKVYPLVINETLFGIGNSMFVKAFGYFGKDVLESYYVGNQIANLFYVVVNGISDATGAMLGASLGKKDYDKASREADYFTGIAIVSAVTIIATIMIFSGKMVDLFSLSRPDIYQLAVIIVKVLSIKIAFRLYNVIVFSALRAGGDSKFLTLLDSGIMWSVGIGSTFIMVYILKIDSIVIVLLFGQLEQLVRLIIGFKRKSSGIWLNNLVHKIDYSNNNPCGGNY